MAIGAAKENMMTILERQFNKQLVIAPEETPATKTMPKKSKKEANNQLR